MILGWAGRAEREEQPCFPGQKAPRTFPGQKAPRTFRKSCPRQSPEDDPVGNFKIRPWRDLPGRRIQSPGSTFSLRDASKEVSNRFVMASCLCPCLYCINHCLLYRLRLLPESFLPPARVWPPAQGLQRQ